MDQISEKVLKFLCDSCGESNTIDKFIRLHDPDPKFYRNSPRYFYRYLYCFKCDIQFRLELLTTFSSEYANVINCGENTLEKINTQIFALEQHKSGLLILKDEQKFDLDYNEHDQEFPNDITFGNSMHDVSFLKDKIYFEVTENEHRNDVSEEKKKVLRSDDEEMNFDSDEEEIVDKVKNIVEDIVVSTDEINTDDTDNVQDFKEIVKVVETDLSCETKDIVDVVETYLSDSSYETKDIVKIVVTGESDSSFETKGIVKAVEINKSDYTCETKDIIKKDDTNKVDTDLFVKNEETDKNDTEMFLKSKETDKDDTDMFVTKEETDKDDTTTVKSKQVEEIINGQLIYIKTEEMNEDVNIKNENYFSENLVCEICGLNVLYCETVNEMNPTYSCGQCSFKTEKESFLKLHLEIIHGETVLTTRNVYNSEDLNADKYYDHIIEPEIKKLLIENGYNHDDNEQNSDFSKNIECDDVLILNENSKYNYFIKNEDSKLNEKCISLDLCEYQEDLNLEENCNSLITDNEVKHNNDYKKKIVTCENSDKQCETKVSLRNSIKTNAKMSLNSCKKCEYNLQHKNSLEKHAIKFESRIQQELKLRYFQKKKFCQKYVQFLSHKLVPRVKLGRRKPKVKLKRSAPRVKLKRSAPRVKLKRSAPRVKLKRSAPRVKLKRSVPRVKLKRSAPRVKLKRLEIIVSKTSF